MDKKYITLIGHDNRTLILENLLIQNGYSVDRIINKESLSKASFYKTIILPIPYSDVSGKIKGTDFSLSDVACKLTPYNFLIFGKKDSAFLDIAQRIGFDYIDLNDDMCFKTLNAIPSAEAAIGIAAEQSKSTLFDSNIMVCGYGCIAKCLVKILNGYGANITVAARKKSDHAEAAYYGCKVTDFNNINNFISDCDIIFNTCPAMILNKDVLDHVKKSCIIVDLASHPGGCDFAYAEKIGLNAKLYLKLPDKYAPKSSGESLYKVISSIISLQESN